MTPKSRLSGQTAVFMAMYPLPNANTLDVIKRVRKEMEANREKSAQRHAGRHRL